MKLTGCPQVGDLSQELLHHTTLSKSTSKMKKIAQIFRNAWDVLFFAWLLLMLAPEGEEEERENTPEKETR